MSVSVYVEMRGLIQLCRKIKIQWKIISDHLAKMISEHYLQDFNEL